MDLKTINEWRGGTVKRLKEIGLTDALPPYEKAFTAKSKEVIYLNAVEEHAKKLGFGDFYYEDSRIWSKYGDVKVRVHVAHATDNVTYSFVSWITEPEKEPREVMVLKVTGDTAAIEQVSFDIAGAILENK